MLSRFAALGDVHVEDERLETVLGFLRGERVDALLCVGDIVDGPGDPERTVRLLEDNDVVCVRGNHDCWLVNGAVLRDAERARLGWTRRHELSEQSFAWLAALPAVRTLESARGSLLLCHGVGDNDMVRFRADSDVSACDEMEALIQAGAWSVVVGGHSHERFARVLTGRRAGSLTFLNPGTLSRRDEPGFAVVDLARGEMHGYDVDLEGHVTAATLERF